MNMKDSIRDCYGKFIGSMDWDIFGTFTHLLPRTENYNRKIISSFYDRNKDLINRLFYVIEKHQGTKYYHTHFLLKTPCVDLVCKSTKPLKRFIDIDLKVIDDRKLSNDGESLRVGYYLSKDITKGVDYGFLGF